MPLRTDRGNFGVLEVDHTASRSFSEDDVHFLTGLGNTMARAVELRRLLTAMEASLDEKQLLLREMNHRIKNNLALVGAMLTLQARRFADSEARNELTRAVARINNLALVHDRLQLFTTSVTAIEAGPHLPGALSPAALAAAAGVSLSARCSGTIRGDAAKSLMLIANELVTNAAKHAFAERDDGEIELGFRQQGAGGRLSAHDDGRPAARSCRDAGPIFWPALLATLAARLNAEVRSVTDGDSLVEVFSGHTD